MVGRVAGLPRGTSHSRAAELSRPRRPSVGRCVPVLVRAAASGRPLAARPERASRRWRVAGGVPGAQLHERPGCRGSRARAKTFQYWLSYPFGAKGKALIGGVHGVECRPNWSAQSGLGLHRNTYRHWSPLDRKCLRSGQVRLHSLARGAAHWAGLGVVAQSKQRERGSGSGNTSAGIGRGDSSAVPRGPARRVPAAGCMGRRRRRVDRADAARALPEALAALSRTLPAGPSPETFRRAKFDLPEAAPALWQLLFRVLSQLRAGGSTASPAPEAQARWVKSELLSQGYPRQGLTQLPEDGSRGSRELLLALSWLLAREPLPEQLLAQTRVHLGDEMPVCECDILASPSLPAPGVEADGPVDIRHLQWLMGKLWFRWRTLMASQQEQCALLGKIHWFTRGCHSDRCLGHLSVAETELLRDPESGQQLLQRLESENARLEAALEWRRREVVFWPWMDTVLGACPLEAPQPSSVHRPRNFGTEELELQLQALQEELRVAAGARRAAWEARVGGQGPEWTIAQQAAQEAVGQELVVLQQAWEQGGGLARAHGPRRLVRTEAGVPAGLGLQAAQVIRVLQSRETCLEEMLRQLQAQCQQQLARLAGALPSLIWILPPGR